MENQWTTPKNDGFTMDLGHVGWPEATPNCGDPSQSSQARKHQMPWLKLNLRPKKVALTSETLAKKRIWIILE